jgi:hypothetical protein
MKGLNDAWVMQFFFPEFNSFNSHWNAQACLLVHAIQCAQINNQQYIRIKSSDILFF